MAGNISKNSISVSKEILKKQGGVVVLGLKEYKRFLKYEMEKEYIDKIIKEGLKEKREGKTEPLESFLKREYPKLYESYKH
ncbi:hypothetical protein J7J81_01725 [bacterium]|nr:hypothetical protein [bacterium]